MREKIKKRDCRILEILSESIQEYHFKLFQNRNCFKKIFQCPT